MNSQQLNSSLLMMMDHRWRWTMQSMWYCRFTSLEKVPHSSQWMKHDETFVPIAIFTLAYYPERFLHMSEVLVTLGAWFKIRAQGSKSCRHKVNPIALQMQNERKKTPSLLQWDSLPIFRWRLDPEVMTCQMPKHLTTGPVGSKVWLKFGQSQWTNVYNCIHIPSYTICFEILKYTSEYKHRMHCKLPYFWLCIWSEGRARSW